MIFKPLAFKYLDEVPLNSGSFITFNIPTTLVITKPGVYAPKQGRFWAISAIHANQLFGVALKERDGLIYYVIEAWVNRGEEYVMNGHALIASSDLPSLINDGGLVANISK